MGNGNDEKTNCHFIHVLLGLYCTTGNLDRDGLSVEVGLRTCKSAYGRRSTMAAGIECCDKKQFAEMENWKTLVVYLWDFSTSFRSMLFDVSLLLLAVTWLTMARNTASKKYLP